MNARVALSAALISLFFAGCTTEPQAPQSEPAVARQDPPDLPFASRWQIDGRWEDDVAESVAGGHDWRSVRRGAVTERLAPHPRGWQQTWTFDEAPADPGDIVVEVSLPGELLGESRAGLKVLTTEGMRVYGHGTWIDARGHRTHVPARWADGKVELRVVADVLADSEFPAVLDPVIGAITELEPPRERTETPQMYINPFVMDGELYLSFGDLPALRLRHRRYDVTQNRLEGAPVFVYSGVPLEPIGHPDFPMVARGWGSVYAIDTETGRASQLANSGYDPAYPVSTGFAGIGTCSGTPCIKWLAPDGSTRTTTVVGSDGVCNASGCLVYDASTGVSQRVTTDGVVTSAAFAPPAESFRLLPFGEGYLLLSSTQQILDADGASVATFSIPGFDGEPPNYDNNEGRPWDVTRDGHLVFISWGSSGETLYLLDPTGNVTTHPTPSTAPGREPMSRGTLNCLGSKCYVSTMFEALLVEIDLSGPTPTFTDLGNIAGGPAAQYRVTSAAGPTGFSVAFLDDDHRRIFAVKTAWLSPDGTVESVQTVGEGNWSSVRSAARASSHFVGWSRLWLSDGWEPAGASVTSSEFTALGGLLDRSAGSLEAVESDGASTTFVSSDDFGVRGTIASVASTVDGAWESVVRAPHAVAVTSDRALVVGVGSFPETQIYETRSGEAFWPSTSVDLVLPTGAPVAALFDGVRFRVYWVEDGVGGATLHTTTVELDGTVGARWVWIALGAREGGVASA